MTLPTPEDEKLIAFIRERAASYGALRKSALTAIALDHAADRIQALSGMEGGGGGDISARREEE